MIDAINEEDPLAIDVADAIKSGATSRLQQLLNDTPGLAFASIVDQKAISRTLLHIATDWPGHFPEVGATIRILIAAGANVNAGIKGAGTETPLHWAASSNDVVAINALLDGGANMDAQGAVISGGDPLEDAIGFQNWDAAKCLVARGAKTTLGDEAAVGLLDKIQKRFIGDNIPSKESVAYSFWNACCAGQFEVARFLLSKGADVNWIPDWCSTTPLDGAKKSKNDDLVLWLEAQGAICNE